MCHRVVVIPARIRRKANGQMAKQRQAIDTHLSMEQARSLGQFLIDRDASEMMVALGKLLLALGETLDVAKGASVWLHTDEAGEICVSIAEDLVNTAFALSTQDE
jgi:hypothetical protein